MLDAIALAYLLRESLQERSTAGSAPLLYDLTPGDAVDEHASRLTLLTSRRHEAKIGPSVVDGARCMPRYHHIVAIGSLELDSPAWIRPDALAATYHAVDQERNELTKNSAKRVSEQST